MENKSFLDPDISDLLDKVASTEVLYVIRTPAEQEGFTYVYWFLFQGIPQILGVEIAEDEGKEAWWICDPLGLPVNIVPVDLEQAVPV